MAAKLALKAAYPCCHQRARFDALLGVPKERYDRLCQRCGQKWRVTRTYAGTREGRRIDILGWEKAGLHRTASERFAGERRRSVNRKTGAVYCLIDATDPNSGFDGADGRWITLCDTHSTSCSHETLALANHHLPSGDWCEGCDGRW